MAPKIKKKGSESFVCNCSIFYVIVAIQIIVIMCCVDYAIVILSSIHIEGRQ